MMQKYQNKQGILDAVEREDEHHLIKHAEFLKRIKSGPIELLFLGDSITRRWEENPEVWNYYFKKYAPANFGVGGDTTQNLKWRILNGELEGIDPGIIVLLIGTNNLPSHNETEIVPAIKDIVEIIHKKLPQAKIVLMGILPRNTDDTGRDYMKMIVFINQELKKLEEKEYLNYLDIGKEYIGFDGKVIDKLMPDGLHLVEPGYKIWGSLLLPLIERIHSA